MFLVGHYNSSISHLQDVGGIYRFWFFLLRPFFFISSPIYSNKFNLIKPYTNQTAWVDFCSEDCVPPKLIPKCATNACYVRYVYTGDSLTDCGNIIAMKSLNVIVCIMWKFVIRRVGKINAKNSEPINISYFNTFRPFLL